MACTIDAEPQQFGWAVRVTIQCLDAAQMNEGEALASVLLGVDRELKRRGWDTVGLLEHPWVD